MKKSDWVLAEKLITAHLGVFYYRKIAILTQKSALIYFLIKFKIDYIIISPPNKVDGKHTLKNNKFIEVV